MKSIGAFEAKTRLNELLRRVSQGETIRITVRGTPVAKLVPDNGAKDPQRTVREMRELRKGARLGGVSIRQLIHEGHRY